MKQYCAYHNLGAGRGVYPYLLNLQHPVANVLNHLLVAPVVELSQLPGGKPPTKICPLVNIGGQTYIVMTHMMAALPARELGEQAADLSTDITALRDAVDFLLNGY